MWALNKSKAENNGVLFAKSRYVYFFKDFFCALGNKARVSKSVIMACEKKKEEERM